MSGAKGSKEAEQTPFECSSVVQPAQGVPGRNEKSPAEKLHGQKAPLGKANRGVPFALRVVNCRGRNEMF